jgi:hypothetical protein
MKIKRRWFLGILTALLFVAGVPSVAVGQAAHVRWDIISINAGVVTPNGVASARANDCSKITLTGSGTFVAPAGGGGTSGAVTGGGTWQTFSGFASCPCNSTATGTSAGSGTYEVTGLVRWELAPGTLLPFGLVDTIDDGTPSAGLAVLRIAYSDGSRGILVVSCHLSGTPNSVFEGITASKGFVDYWNREAPTNVPFVDADRTLFHVR